MAKAMGIRHLWDLDNKRWDLTQYSGKDLFGPHIGYNVSIGGFGITTLDNADGVATVAARGVQADAHFVQEVDQGAKVVWREVIKQNKVTETMGISQQAMDDEAWAMATVNQTGLAKNHLASGRPAGAKTGTWELGATKDNSQAWYVGFTPQIATAVNISSRDPKNLAIRYASGKTTAVMNGTNTPGDIWKKFMDTVLKGQKVLPLPAPKHVGDTTAGNAASPQPSVPADQGGGQGGGGGNGGGNGGPGNGGNPCLIPALCATPTPRPSHSGGHG
jgi:membrane peptidoglycan carboxypeptidase